MLSRRCLPEEGVKTECARNILKDYKGNVMNSVRKAKGLIQSGLFDELTFKSRDKKVKMMS